MKALILAGGRGERLKPLTDCQPKCMVGIAGKPCLERVVDHLSSFGIPEVMVNLHWLYPQVLEYFGTRFVYLYEPDLLGTAGTIKKVLPWLGDNFLVMNGDTPTNLNVEKFINWFLANPFHVGISVKENSFVCDGVMVFNKDISKFLPETGMIDDVIANLPQSYCGYYFDPETIRFDIGTLEKLEKARKYYEEQSRLLSKV